MGARGVNSPRRRGRHPYGTLQAMFRRQGGRNSTEFDPEKRVVAEFRGNRLRDGLSKGPEDVQNSPNQHQDSTVKPERPSFAIEELDDCGGSDQVTGRSARSAWPGTDSSIGNALTSALTSKTKRVMPRQGSTAGLRESGRAAACSGSLRG